MQHINRNTTHLQNVNTCGLISKHPFVTNSKIYNRICTHTFAQLRTDTPSGVPARCPQLAGHLFPQCPRAGCSAQPGQGAGVTG